MVMFTARRSTPELVVPARPTPRETKNLSDLDDQGGLRWYVTVIDFFRPVDGHGRRQPHDLAKAIKAALAEALVYYYPIAGRLRELPGGNKLVVNCTAEGVVFVEASADVRLEELGQPLVPPYPCVEELLCGPGDTQVVVGKPLFFMQVTRFSCGGFATSLHMCHTICDGFGIYQFMKAIADIARGEALPTVLPVWKREILVTPKQPSKRFTSMHLAYEPFHDGSSAHDDVALSTPPDDMAGQYFLFGPSEIALMRSHLPMELRHCSTAFELLTAALWKCRTAALRYAPDQRVRVLFALNARGRWKRNPPLPRGFYGNALLLPAAEAIVSELCGSPLCYALDLVRKAKFGVNDEYVDSTMDMMASHGRPHFVENRTYLVSDITCIGEDELDFGWGERVGGGVPMAGDFLSKFPSFHMRCKNGNGEDCVMVPMYLPRSAMERFAEQIALLLKKQEKKLRVTSL